MTGFGLRPGGNPRRLLLAFLGILLPPAVTLVWLGWKLLDQDRALAATRAAERRHVMAAGVMAELDHSLAEAERWFSGDAPPEGTLRLVVSVSGMSVEPASRALWVPQPPALPEAASAQFAEAELLEFRGSADRALPVYRGASSSTDPAVRAGALLRLARTQRAAARTEEALATYRLLANVRGIAINGMPADLLARRAICDVLHESGRAQDFGRETAALGADFTSGHWTLDRPSWALVSEDLARWTGEPTPSSSDRFALSAAAEWIWSEWRDHANSLASSGRRVIQAEQIPVTVLWRRDGQTLGALAILPAVLNGWVRAATARTGAAVHSVGLTTESGEWIAGGRQAASGGALTLPAAESRLPWNVTVAAGADPEDARDLAFRERLLAAGLAAVVLLLAGGSWWLWRVMRRELAVARLQTDFVSAVSHEFRTPLTSLQHVTELLDEDDDLPAERRKSFYASLGRNTERLRGLVESLLDFGRMESGRKPYDLRTEDAGVIAAETVAEFEKDVVPRGFHVDLDLNGGRKYGVRADRAALSRALWNLLDNAVKYSAESRSVWVSVGRSADEVVVAVRDAGIGIPGRERKEIFHKFVRGERAKELGIKGTGLGLALVSHIVEAHAGRIEIESEEGRGSTFRLVLPAVG